jgi:hypothetical protein
MARLEQVTAAHYPEDWSALTINPMESVIMSGALENAIHDFGNDTSVTIPCTTDSEELFTIDLTGHSKRELNGRFYPEWQITFRKAQKMLKLSVTETTAERFEGDHFVAASNLDISDLWAVWFDALEFEKQAELQGFDRYQAKLRIIEYHFPGLLGGASE